MSKVLFRPRQIDYNKPLPIIRHDGEFLAEISENDLVSRGVPTIPSGMEKEEENEHHFLEVIQALQNKKKKADAYIPVPEITEDPQRFYKLYPKGFTPPNQLIHLRTAIFADDEPVDYDMDSEDEQWLSNSGLDISSDKFEAMIDKLERGCGQKVMNLEEAKYLLQDDQSLAIAIYDYWLTKRVQCRQPLLLYVKQEKRDGTSNNNHDPYVAFRRRTERMQTRKNRKNDENSYEKMLILREQMDALEEIFSSLVKRETTKEALIANEKEIFLLRCKMADCNGVNIAEAEASISKFSHPATMKRPIEFSPRKRGTKKRRAPWQKHEPADSDEVLTEEENTAGSTGEFAFVRQPGVKYLKPIGRLATNAELDGEYMHPSLRYRLTTVPAIDHPSRHLYTGFVRRRFGRGGRVVLDRVHTQYSNYLAKYDCELSCYDHSERNTSTRPMYIEELEQNSRIQADKRLRAMLPLTRLRIQPDSDVLHLEAINITPDSPPSPTHPRKRYDRPPTTIAVRKTVAKLPNGAPSPSKVAMSNKQLNGKALSTRLVNGQQKGGSGSVVPKRMTQNGASGDMMQESRQAAC